MKTNQEMIRKMGEFNIIQRTNDGYFDANALLSQWNRGNKRKRMVDFKNSKSTIEFIEALKFDESLWRNFAKGDNQVVINVKGRMTKNGRTDDKVWMHPLLFIDFAMWINPSFKVQVLKFVYDEMVRYRNDAGDAYRELSAAISKIVPNDFMPKAIQKTGEAINWVVFNTHERALRNKHGNESKQRDLYEIEKKVADLINDGFITRFDDVIAYLRVQYQKRNDPQVFKK